VPGLAETHQPMCYGRVYLLMPVNPAIVRKAPITDMGTAISGSTMPQDALLKVQKYPLVKSTTDSNSKIAPGTTMSLENVDFVIAA
jgi:hypothetical protein